MNEEKKILLEKIKKNKEQIVEIKNKHGQKYEELQDNIKTRKNSKKA